MKHILFVDDEPKVLEGLERMLFPLQRQYKMAFAPSGARALEMMAQHRFDVIVSDMRMPGMDGAQLLGEVKKRHPDTLRFVLTGQSDSETVFRSVGDAHQFLSKPCKPATLKECVDKAFALRDLLESDTLKELVAQVGALPPVPALYTRLCEELQSPEGSISNVGRIIETDVAMTAKLLQLVNSAFFSLRQHVTTATQAASLLGFETIKALVLLAGLFDAVGKRKMSAHFCIDTLLAHSMTVGKVAQAISRKEDASKSFRNDAYTAGLLHDAGKLILASSAPDDYAHVFDVAAVNDVHFTDAEREVLGCTHAEVGAYLLGIWGLPNQIVEAVAYHHSPADFPARGMTPLAAVHAADALVHGEKSREVRVGELNEAYFANIGLHGRLPEWEAACLAAIAQQED